MFAHIRSSLLFTVSLGLCRKSSRMTSPGLFICCIVLHVLGLTYSETLTENMDMLRTVKVRGTPISSLNATSRLRCAGACARNTDCYVGQYFPETKLCQLFSKLDMWFQVPFSNTVNLSVMKKREPINKVALVRSSSGSGRLSKAEARSSCSEIGGSLATYSNMQAAYYGSPGLHVGVCSHIEGGIYYVLQHLVPGIGYAGMNSCYWKSETSNADAFCHIP